MLASSSSTALQALARSLSTSSAAAAQAQALVAKPSSSGGLLAAFGFGSARIDTPLTEALPTAVKPLRSTLPTAAAKLEAGALSAGTKVVAVNSAGPVSSICLVFGAGPAYESEELQGVSRVVEALAFKSTTNRTTFRITRELEKIGANASVKVARDHISYNISAVKLHVPEVAEVLLDAVLNARLNYWEVQDAISAAKATLTNQLRDPHAVLSDVLHRAAFDGSLGLPLYPDPSVLDHITKESLQSFLSSTLKPSSAVLAAAGVTLDEFKELAGPLVGASHSAHSSSSTTPAPSSSYVGGSLNVLAPTSPLAYVALAFEAKGGLADAKGAAAASVAQALLDQSAVVLPHTSKGEGELLAGAKGFSHLYRDTGLVGLTAAAPPSQVSALVDAISKKLEGIAKGASEPQLKAAKQVALGAFKAQVSSASGLAAAAAPALLLSGKFSPADFVAAVEGLGSGDVSGYVSKALKSAPTYVTYGSLSGKVPRYEAVAKRFA